MREEKEEDTNTSKLKASWNLGQETDHGSGESGSWGVRKTEGHLLLSSKSGLELPHSEKKAEEQMRVTGCLKLVLPETVSKAAKSQRYSFS